MINKILKKIQNRVSAKQERVNPVILENSKRWVSDNGDETLRLNYPLNENSVVFDLGGYKGEWSEKIFCKYNCNIFIFELLPRCLTVLNNKFSHNSKIKIFPFGLSAENETLKIFENSHNDGASLFVRENKNLDEIEAKIKDIKEFIFENKIEKIDLMKINIEGGEYDLINRMIETNIVNIVNNLQIQFHDFVDNADIRMKEIQLKLSKTHRITYQYTYIWENWELK